MNLIYKELNKLIDDYYLCECLEIKEHIKCDIQLLTEAVYIYGESTSHLE
ncbi:hypothetical protein [Psychrobacillus sp. FSL H8-0487]